MPDIEFVPWDEFKRRFRWEQGEHLTFVGPTGSGKTTLAVGLLPLRDFVCAMATKPRDKTMDRLIRESGYKKIPAWPPPPIAGRSSQRVVLWPRFMRPSDLPNQQIVMDNAIREMFTAGGWTIFADELFYLCKMLNMTRLLEILWTQGRSIGVTIVGGTQRPAHIPLLAYDQATHLFFFRDNDETNLKRIGSLGGMDAKRIRTAVANLPKHHALYLNTRDGEMMITQAEDEKGKRKSPRG
jgi:hypothetical protein